MIHHYYDYEGDSSIPNGTRDIDFIDCSCDGRDCGKELDRFYAVDRELDEQYCFDCFIRYYSKCQAKASNERRCEYCEANDGEDLYLIEKRWYCTECIDEVFLHDLDEAEE